MIEALKAIFIKFHGILTPNSFKVVPEEKEIFDEIICDLEMLPANEDKKNMKMDGANFKKDYKKAFSAYYIEMMNG